MNACVGALVNDEFVTELASGFEGTFHCGGPLEFSF